MKVQNILPFSGIAATTVFAACSIFIGWHWISYPIVAMIYLAFLCVLRRGKEVDKANTEGKAELAKIEKRPTEIVVEEPTVRVQVYKVFWTYTVATLVVAIILALTKDGQTQNYNNSMMLFVAGIVGAFAAILARKAWYKIGLDVAFQANIDDMHKPLN